LRRENAKPWLFEIRIGDTPKTPRLRETTRVCCEAFLLNEKPELAPGLSAHWISFAIRRRA
jgi:hypothetical protein